MPFKTKGLQQQKYLKNKKILWLKFLKVAFPLILDTVYVVPLDFPLEKWPLHKKLYKKYTLSILHLYFRSSILLNLKLSASI